MISQEQFAKLEYEHGCGYWNLCWEHACPCAITVEHKGLRQDIWNSMVEENKQIAEQYTEECENDDSYYEEDMDDYLEAWYEAEDDKDYEKYECPFCHQVPTPSGRCDCSNI